MKIDTIKAVIFDLDGTLANTLPLCIAAFRKSIEPLIERKVSDQEIIATFGPSEEGTIMALAPEHYEQGISAYLNHYKALHDQMCPTPFEGMEDILSMLKHKGVRVAMVTGKGKYSTAISLKQFGLNTSFEKIETGDPAGPRKEEGIHNILNDLDGLSAKEVIYVGDSPSDITFSRKAGIPVTAAAWAETAEPEKLLALEPDELFYEVREFKNWLHARI